MANVLRPLPSHSHSAPAIGFGFGVPSTSMAPSWQHSTTPTPHATPASPFQHLAHNITVPSSVQRMNKRRHEPEEGSENSRDEVMDRSPTPERPKRSLPSKRVRTSPSADVATRDNKGLKASESDDNDVDVGFLLANLPEQSYLPLLTAIIKEQPSVKSAILRLIPRPPLDTVISRLAASAKRLSDAYPYSTIPSFGQPAAAAFSSGPTGFGFGFGFGLRTPTPQTPDAATSQQNGCMRDDYILSRLRPHIADFVSVVQTYLPYYSYVTNLPSSANAQSHSNILQSTHRDKFTPAETFQFLAALTRHILSQPQLTQTSLVPHLLDRLEKEWSAWVNRVDEVVNRAGGMFGGEVVKSWESYLDEFSAAKSSEWAQMFKGVRHAWVSKVGWLVGRMEHAMDEN